MCPLSLAAVKVPSWQESSPLQVIRQKVPAPEGQESPISLLLHESFPIQDSAPHVAALASPTAKIEIPKQSSKRESEKQGANFRSMGGLWGHGNEAGPHSSFKSMSDPRQ